MEFISDSRCRERQRDRTNIALGVLLKPSLRDPSMVQGSLISLEKFDIIRADALDVEFRSLEQQKEHGMNPASRPELSVMLVPLMSG
jgi:hypothetical protein